MAKSFMEIESEQNKGIKDNIKEIQFEKGKPPLLFSNLEISSPTKVDESQTLRHMFSCALGTAGKTKRIEKKWKRALGDKKGF